MVMNDQTILEVNCHKPLGMLFSSNRTWHNHINHITSKAWTRINAMRKLKFVLDRIASNYSRTSVARTLMARLPRLFRTPS